jgi:hypothetical protein
VAILFFSSTDDVAISPNFSGNLLDSMERLFNTAKTAVCSSRLVRRSLADVFKKVKTNFFLGYCGIESMLSFPMMSVF